MSLQAGIWNFDGKPVTLESLTTISEPATQWGPDGITTYVDGSLGMVYRPFHTTAEARLERQPYITSGGNVFTWDGRLDNRDELILALCNDLIDERTDVAIVAAAFEKWGTGCFPKITGDWALTIWHRQNRELILARDYIGIKHLFYYLKPRRMVLWCNYLEALALCGDQFSLSEEYAASSFGVYPDSHLTPYREILSLPPASFVRIRDDNCRTDPYWTFNPHFKTRYKTDAEYECHFIDLFRQSVRRRLRTDSPVLADLSGGQDSSAIVCMADDILAKREVEVPSLDTFSFFDPEEPDEEDFLYFTKVEEKRGRSGYHAEIHSTGNTFPVDYSNFVASPGIEMREELKTEQSDVIRRGKYRVTLSGAGGDEFLGYTLDPRVQIADLIMSLRLRSASKELFAWSVLAGRPLIHLLLGSLLLRFPTRLRTRLLKKTDLEPWLNPHFDRRHRIRSRLLRSVEGSRWWSETVRHWFQTYARTAARMSDTRPFIAERRYPFLDQQLTEFLMSIPNTQLVRPGNRRSLSRRALAHIVPDEILARRTKAGTGRCYSLTVEKNWSRIQSVVHSPLISRLGYVNERGFRDALQGLRTGRVPIHLGPLLRALSLEFWLSDVVKRGLISFPGLRSHNALRSRSGTKDRGFKLR
jgi:asparagine synthase (glutamine-hydrolysing)